MSRFDLVWVLSHYESIDVPRGVLGVYATKAAGLRAANRELEGEEEITRSTYRWKRGQSVSWNRQGPDPYGLTLEPREVWL